MDLSNLEKQWAERGFSFGMGTIKADDGVDRATHNEKHEIVVMEKGHYEFTLGDKTFTQTGGVEVLIPAGVTHSIKNIGDTDSRIYFGYKAVAP